MSTKKVLFFCVKIVVTVGLLALLLSVVDVQDVMRKAFSVPLYALLVASLCYVFATLISTFRWSWLLKVQGVSIPLMSLVSYNLSYSFYSMVLPGGKVSAEALRIYQILRDSGHPEIRERIFLPTVLDRLMMVLASAVIALVYFLFHANDIQTAVPWWFSYAAAGVVFLIILSIFFPFERFALRVMNEEAPPRMSLLASMRKAIEVFRGHTLTLFSAFIASLFVNVFVALAFYSIALSLGVTPGFILVFGILSVGMLATVIPITIGGIGAREGVVAVLLSAATGISIETSVTISLVTLATSLIIVVCGACVEFHRHFIRHES